MARKLTTILAADVAGYSRLMERDEQATLSALKRVREIIAKNITAYHGRIFGGAGDSVIAEFGSAVEATETAIAIQKELASQGKGASGTTVLQLRIGLNIGDAKGNACRPATRDTQLSAFLYFCISKSARWDPLGWFLGSASRQRWPPPPPYPMGPPPGWGDIPPGPSKASRARDRRSLERGPKKPQNVVFHGLLCWK